MNRPDPTPETETLLVDAVAGELSPADAVVLERLLADDPSLQALLDEQTEIRSLLTPDVAPIGDLERRRLRAAVRGEIAPRQRRWLLSTVAAGFVVLVGVGALLNNGSPFGGGADATPPSLAATRFDLDESDGVGYAESFEAEDDSGDTGPTAASEASGAGPDDGTRNHIADGYVPAGALFVPVSDLEDVRDLPRLPAPTPASETGLECFADDTRLVVIAARVVTPDDTIHDVVVAEDDELDARPADTC